MNAKNRLSYLAFAIGLLLVVFIRFSYHKNNENNGYNATTWDALGYYIYLPSIFIYNDVSELKWFNSLDANYNLSGGTFYQATEIEEGKHVFKYLGGVAILQAPFFFIGHLYAQLSDYPPDGFSAPYQYAIIWGAIFWFLMGLWVLIKVLRCFFTDSVTAIVILLLVGASNLIQYVSIDGAMSHAFLFPMYSLLLWYTIKWHEKYQSKYVFFIGLIIGLSTISRPTELIMIFIPLLWGIHSKKDFIQKICFLFKDEKQILYAVFGGLIGILPQLIYWKVASGDWIYNVGSKWYFLNPWWRVLFGFEKGWFIYTPVAVFTVLGFFYMRGKTFQKAILFFSLLNIWIIISWSDWQYGASYSTRALTHSYPVFALPLAAFVTKIIHTRFRFLWMFLGAYLIATNLFQIWQYNAGVLHYRDMNRKYYSQIYWNSNPSPIQYSLLDSDRIYSENELKQSELIYRDSVLFMYKAFPLHEEYLLFDLYVNDIDFLINTLIIKANEKELNGFIIVREFASDSLLSEKKFRTRLPFYDLTEKGVYEHHFCISEYAQKLTVSLQFFETSELQNIFLSVSGYKKSPQ